MNALPMAGEAPAPLSGEIAELPAEVRALAAARDAVILAHNYQLPEIQDVADSSATRSRSPSRRRAPRPRRSRSAAFTSWPRRRRSSRREDRPDPRPRRRLLAVGLDHAPSSSATGRPSIPGALVVMYVNTSAEVKALTDYCCTSSNAVAVVRHIYETHGADTEILFGPDMFLGAYVERELGRRMHVWDGECHVHAGIRPADIAAARAAHPGAEFLIHPECGCSTSVMEYVAAGDIDADGVHMLSTGGMLALRRSERRPGRARSSRPRSGCSIRCARRRRRSSSSPPTPRRGCRFMKMITLPKLRDGLRDGVHEVRVPAEVAAAARLCDRADGRDRLSQRLRSRRLVRSDAGDRELLADPRAATSTISSKVTPSIASIAASGSMSSP